MFEALAFVADVLIFVWLVGTWFYEGHHKRCKVTLSCPNCGVESEQKCLADYRE